MSEIAFNRKDQRDERLTHYLCRALTEPSIDCPVWLLRTRLAGLRRLTLNDRRESKGTRE